MTYENYIKAKLVDVAVREAYASGSWDTMRAVAQVMANRVNAGWGDWKKVLDSSAEYVGTVRDAPQFNPSDMLFRQMLALIDDVYYGTADDSLLNFTDSRGSNVALYYADLNDLNRPWFQEHILSDPKGHPRLAQAHPLTFFA